MSQMLHDRLADLRVEMRADTETRHIAAVEAELRNPQAPVPLRSGRRRRFRTLVLVALVVLIPAAAAVAAEDAVPGDLLYPVKQTTEWFRSLTDPTIDARHRVEELEMVVDRRAPLDELEDRLFDAENSVQDHPNESKLVDRVGHARDRIAHQHPSDTETEKTDQSPDQTRHRDGGDSGHTSTTTTTAAKRDQVHNSTTTSTRPISDNDQPPGDGDRRNG